MKTSGPIVIHSIKAQHVFYIHLQTKMPPILTVQEQFSKILNRHHVTKEEADSSSNELRWLVLTHPCPTEVNNVDALLIFIHTSKHDSYLLAQGMDLEGVFGT